MGAPFLPVLPLILFFRVILKDEIRMLLSFLIDTAEVLQGQLVSFKSSLFENAYI